MVNVKNEENIWVEYEIPYCLNRVNFNHCSKKNRKVKLVGLDTTKYPRIFEEVKKV